MQEDGRALSSDDIKAKCGIDIHSDSGLMAALQNHDRLELVNGFWSYKVGHSGLICGVLLGIGTEEEGWGGAGSTSVVSLHCLTSSLRWGRPSIRRRTRTSLRS
jgi:hypothetical protein